MNTSRFLLPLLFGASVLAQTVTVFPDEYVAVPEGPLNSRNYPLAYGTSRMQCLYEAIDLAIPSGHQITKVGFREDATYTTLNTGYSLQLEIRMGYSQETAASMTSTFATNYSTTPVTVFGPALYTLPDLRDPANPLPNGQFFITLSTPFTYDPSLGNLVVEYRILANTNNGQSFTYYLDRADFYSPRTYGPAGCAGNSGIPSLSLAEIRPGYSFSAYATGGPGSSFGVLAVVPGGQLVTPFSLTPYVATIQATCLGQVNLPSALVLTGVTNGSGAKTWSFYIPNDPFFNDFDWACQAAFFDFFAPGGVIVSNGGHVQTGARTRSSLLRASGPPNIVTTGSVSRYYCPVAFFEHQ